MARARAATSERKAQVKTVKATTRHKTASTSAFKVPTRGAAPSKLTRAQVVSQGEGLVRSLSRQLRPEELDDVLQTLRRTFLPAAPADEAKQALVARLSGGRTFSPGEQARVELENKRRSFAFRRELLEGALSASQVADLLGTSRQTPHDRVKAGTLLAVQDGGIWKFPPWQFEASGPDGVVPGLTEVLRALGEYRSVSPLGKVSFLSRPSPYLGGRTPLEALKAGDVDDVVAVARAVGVV